jgi:hypothetical protein
MKNAAFERAPRPAARRGFTLVELLVAGIVITLVVGAVATSLVQVGRARSSARLRLEAYLRADAALDAIRRDVQSVIRSDDLYWTRLVLFDDEVRRRYRTFDRDELLVFNTSLASARPFLYNGEGGEYETQYRVEEDEFGGALWVRRDPVPDRWDFGGGMATPRADGVVGLLIQAYDGDTWFDEWDSDIKGLPWAVRVQVTASGAPLGADPYEDDLPMVTLRTVVPIDRVPQPYEPPDPDMLLDLDGDGTISAAEEAAGASGGLLFGGAGGALGGGSAGGAAAAAIAGASGGGRGGSGGGAGGASGGGPKPGGSGGPGMGGGNRSGSGARGGSPIQTGN